MNIIDTILTYHQSLLFFLEIINDWEDCYYCVSSLDCPQELISNYPGKTRCGTTVDLFLNKLLFDTKNRTKERVTNTNSVNDSALISKVEFTEKLLSSNLIEVQINPDHVFFLYKIEMDWYLLASWINLYPLLVMKINIDELLDKIYNYFYLNRKDSEYDYFLQKYFLFKYSCSSTTTFISKNIDTVHHTLLTLNDSWAVEIQYKGYKVQNDRSLLWRLFSRPITHKHEINIIVYGSTSISENEHFRNSVLNLYSTVFKSKTEDVLLRRIKQKILLLTNITEPDFEKGINWLLKQAVIKERLYKLNFDTSYLDRLTEVLEDLYNLNNLIMNQTSIVMSVGLVGSKSFYESRLVEKYSKKILDLIDKNRQEFIPLLGGSRSFSSERLLDIRTGNIVNFLFNHYEFINKKNVIDAITESEIPDSAILFQNQKSLQTYFNRFNFTNFSLKIYFDITHFIVTKTKIRLENEVTYYTYIVMHEKDGRLYIVETQKEFIADVIITSFTTFNENLYIENIVFPSQVKVTSVVLKTKLNLEVTNTKVEEVLLKMYKEKKLNFNFINLLARYQNDTIKYGSEYLYIPFVKQTKSIQIKQLYLNFNRFHEQYNNHIKLLKMLLSSYKYSFSSVHTTQHDSVLKETYCEVYGSVNITEKVELIRNLLIKNSWTDYTVEVVNDEQINVYYKGTIEKYIELKIRLYEIMYMFKLDYNTEFAESTKLNESFLTSLREKLMGTISFMHYVDVLESQSETYVLKSLIENNYYLYYNHHKSTVYLRLSLSYNNNVHIFVNIFSIRFC